MKSGTRHIRLTGELYARRWEHELYYREMKRVLRKDELLNSHTVETVASSR